MPEIQPLCETPEHLPLVAAWIRRNFLKRASTAQVEKQLRQTLDSENLPLTRVALVNGLPAGTGGLRYRDLAARPDLGPWLVALYVEPAFRHRGIGRALVHTLCSDAADLGHETLFLATEMDGFYEKAGFTFREKAPSPGRGYVRVYGCSVCNRTPTASSKSALKSEKDAITSMTVASTTS